MKIKIVLPLLFLFCSLQVRSQSIPNGSFENWYWLGGWVLVPNDWHANNSQLTYFVQQDSSAYNGNFAARLITNGNLFTGFTVTMHPITLDLAVKSFINGNDAAGIYIAVFSGGNLVDAGTYLVTSTIPSWTALSIPISQNAFTADSVLIQITGGIQSGTYLVVDDLRFNATIGMPDQTSDATEFVFPNPVSHNDALSFYLPSVALHSICIYDMAGKKVLEKSISGKNNYIFKEISLAKGSYVVRATCKIKSVTSKLIVE